MVNHLMAPAELVKSTSYLPSGTMTRFFRYYGVPLMGEGYTEDWTYFGLKNINQLKLEPFPTRHSAKKNTKRKKKKSKLLLERGQKGIKKKR